MAAPLVILAIGALAFRVQQTLLCLTSAHRVIPSGSRTFYDFDTGEPLFPGIEQNLALTVGNDTVTINLDFYGSYILTGLPPDYIGIGKSITVGNIAGDVGNLTIDNGTLISQSSGGVINGIILGDAAGSSGTMTLRSTYLQADGDFRIGRFGDGAFNLTYGSQAVTTGTVMIADRIGSTGIATVDSSVWNHTGSFYLDNADGALSVINNGVLTADFLASNGTVSVTGPNSSVTATSFVLEGDTTITQGASLSGTSDYNYIGSYLNADVTTNLTIDGAGSGMYNTGSVITGMNTTNITITNGGLLAANGELWLGGTTLDGRHGGINVTVSGAGSRMISQNYMSIGGSSTIDSVVVNVENGAQISAPTMAIGSADTLNMSNGTANITSGAGVLNNNGIVNVSGAAPSTINGDVTNNGTVKTTDTTLQVTGTFTNNGAYISDPSINIFGNLVIGADGYLVGGLGDEFVVNGDFTNNSTQASLWDTSLATLVFDVAGVHDLTIASNDFGIDGAANNFNWGELRLETGVSLNLFDDASDGAALYVGLLDLADGLSQLNSQYNIYYDGSLEGNSYLSGQTIVLDSGGTLAPGSFPSAVPVPSALWLFGSGLPGLIGIARRKKAA